MSDRREKVARALYELTSMSQVARIAWGDVQGTVRDLFLREADAALAVIDAEPTNAEVKEAHKEHWDILNRDGYIRSKEAMRAAPLAFLAARKDRT